MKINNRHTRCARLALRVLIGLALSVAVSFQAYSIHAQEHGGVLPDPRRPGPYPVGVTTRVYVDETRTDASSRTPRTLVTEIWYPAAEAAREMPPNRFSDFLSGHPDLGAEFVRMSDELFGTHLDLARLDEEFENFAVRDAPAAEGTWPLLISSHGNSLPRFFSTYWCDHLASHGYIVIAPDHTGNALVTAVGDQIVPFKTTWRGLSMVHRPKDISFLIDKITEIARRAEEPDAVLFGRVDLARIGVSGMSFGGYTTAEIINRDPRVKAIVPQVASLFDRTNFTTPVMVMMSTEDHSIGPRGTAKNRLYYEQSQGPRYFVELKDGGHRTYSDFFQFDPTPGNGIGRGPRMTDPDEIIDFLPRETAHEIINAYSTAFFGVHLKGEDGYRAFLAQNHYPEEIIYKSDPAD